MGNRLDLQTLLENIPGVLSVYFQPPSTVSMVYPCIVYQRSLIRIRHANNNPYSHKKQYTVTVIDKNPDTVIPDYVGLLETASFDRRYVVDNLYHDVFTIYF